MHNNGSIILKICRVRCLDGKYTIGLLHLVSSFHGDTEGILYVFRVSIIKFNLRF